VKIVGNEEKAKWYSMMSTAIKIGKEKQEKYVQEKGGAEKDARKAGGHGGIDDLFSF
jgi:hypothetical protein